MPHFQSHPPAQISQLLQEADDAMLAGFCNPSTISIPCGAENATAAVCARAYLAGEAPVELSAMYFPGKKRARGGGGNGRTKEVGRREESHAALLFPVPS